MNPENLKTVKDCDCIENTFEDSENNYVRKIKDNKLTEADFKSHWERGIGIDSSKCEDICSFKGVSINKFSLKEQDNILKKYNTTFSINRRKGGFLVKFTFNKNSGRIKYSPNSNDNTHHNFYKTEDFDLSKINVVEIVKFA